MLFLFGVCWVKVYKKEYIIKIGQKAINLWLFLVWNHDKLFKVYPCSIAVLSVDKLQFNEASQ